MFHLFVQAVDVCGTVREDGAEASVEGVVEDHHAHNGEDGGAAAAHRPQTGACLCLCNFLCVRVGGMVCKGGWDGVQR